MKIGRPGCKALITCGKNIRNGGNGILSQSRGAAKNGCKEGGQCARGGLLVLIIFIIFAPLRLCEIAGLAQYRWFTASYLVAGSGTEFHHEAEYRAPPQPQPQAGHNWKSERLVQLSFFRSLAARGVSFLVSGAPRAEPRTAGNTTSRILSFPFHSAGRVTRFDSGQPIYRRKVEADTTIPRLCALGTESLYDRESALVSGRRAILLASASHKRWTNFAPSSFRRSPASAFRENLPSVAMVSAGDPRRVALLSNTS